MPKSFLIQRGFNEEDETKNMEIEEKRVIMPEAAVMAATAVTAAAAGRKKGQTDFSFTDHLQRDTDKVWEGEEGKA